MAVLFSNYLVLWISSFKSSGYLESDQQAKDIYIKIMLFSVIVSSVIFPFIGKLCDSVDSKRIVPIAFGCRAILNVCFYYLSTPDSVLTYIVCISIVLTCVLEDISNNSIFYKALSKDTRGMLFGIQSIIV